MAEAVTLTLSGFEGVQEMLARLPADVVSKRGGPVKLTLKKAANLIAKAERQALIRTLQDPDDETTGLLQKSVIVSRGKGGIQGENGERYLVRIKSKIYALRTGKPTTTLKTAQLKEYGSSHQMAEPFIRPAFLENAEAAIRLVELELPKAIEKLANVTKRT